MSLDNDQKEYLKDNIRSTPPEKIAEEVEADVSELKEYLQRIWRQDKYERIMSRHRKNPLKVKSDLNWKSFWQKNWWQVLLIILIGLVVYANSLNNEFLSDDIPAIAKNEQLDTFSYVTRAPRVFLRHLFYFIINQLFGRAPWAFRSLNVIFHLGTSLLILLIGHLLKHKWAGLSAGLIFVAHPLLIESVTWISGGPYTQYTFFTLLAFFFYLRGKEQPKANLWANIAFFLALISSGKAIVYPFLLIAYELSNQTLQKNWRKIIPSSLLTIVWTGILVASIPGRLQTLETQHYQKKTTINPFFQIPAAISSYIILFFWPKNLTLYHSEMSFSNLAFTGRVLLTLSYLGTLAYTFFKKKCRRYFFWLAFFGVSLLPMLTPFGISWIVAERYVYLGTVGLTFTLGLLWEQLFKKDKKVPAVITLAVLVIGLGIRTITRNNDWQNQDTLWLAAAKTSPNSPQNNNNLGDMYARWGKYEKSLEHFQRAIKLKPGYADAYHNMAITYRKMGEIDKAITSYKKALELNPRLWQSCQDLTVIYYQQEDYEEAVAWAKKAIEINPTNPKMYANLAILYEKWGKPDKALEVLTKGLAVNRDDPTLRSLYAQLQNNDKEPSSD